MPYWQLYYHIITATKGRTPCLDAETSRWIFQAIQEKAGDLDVPVLAVNGVLDHIHLVAAIPPKLAVANFIGQIKGFSSAYLNQYHPLAEHFEWQESYGVFSFDKKRLPFLIDYVENQKTHHQERSTILVLERYEEPDHRVAEGRAAYVAGETDDFPV